MTELISFVIGASLASWTVWSILRMELNDAKHQVELQEEIIAYQKGLLDRH